MDILKSIDKICEPDSRQKNFVILDTGTKKWRQRTLQDHYTEINDIKLDSNVPEKIRIHFDTARNLLLYSWFAYRLIQVAELHAYASVEFALREKTGEKKGGLKRLISLAIKEGWISDSGFRLHHQRIRDQLNNYKYIYDNKKRAALPNDIDGNQKYCRVLAEALPYLRNELAHGSPMLSPGGYAQLAICADLINQLFKKEERDL